MSESEANIHALDAAYKPFPTFKDWAANTSIDSARWDRYKAELQNRPSPSSESVRRAYEIVKRAAALDTGAIEGLYEVDRGFTFTVAFETAAWEVELAKRGENVRPLFEAQLHAYDYVLDLATKAEPISEAAIRRLHEVVCAAQTTYRVMTSIGPQEQELVKGRYKVLPNHVRTRDGKDHSYAPVDVTPPEMQRLVGEMRSDALLAAHPVIQAAYAHYGLVVIHPFADGNGRVARALASVFTYRAISMPVMILSEHKNAYLDALEAADRGEHQSFVDFMLARSLDTMRLAKESLLGIQAPSVEQGVVAIKSLYVTRGGYTQKELDDAGSRLIGLIDNAVAKVVGERTGTELAGRVSTVVTRDPKIVPGAAYRLPSDSDREMRLLRVEFSTAAPAFARVHRNYALWLPIDAAGDDDIQLVQVFDEGYQLGNQISVPMHPIVVFSARIDELVPGLSPVLRISAALFAERVVGEMLADLAPLAQKALRGQS
jgi:Fic family protein